MDKNSYLIKLAESDRTQLGRIDFAAQSPEQRVFSAIWVLEAEVNNGGFDQYFHNTDLATVSFAPAALREIGAHMCADIVSRALVIAPDLESPEAARQLDGLDSEFYAYPNDLTDLLYAYVAAHPASFTKAPSGA